MSNEDRAMPDGEILFYQTDEGNTKVEVRIEQDTVWMTQASIAELYGTTPQNITMHLKNIFDEGELDETSTCKDYLQVQEKRVVKESLTTGLKGKHLPQKHENPIA